MEGHSTVLLAIISLMLIHFCHCNTNSNGDNPDHHNDGTSNGLQLQTDIEAPLQSTSSSSSSQGNQLSEESEIIRNAKDTLLRSILKNAVIEVSRYLRVIDAAKQHDDMASYSDETTLDAYAPANSGLLGNEDPEQDGDVDVMSILKRSSTSQPAPLRKRQLNALERAVIRQEILRRLEENKSPLEIPIGLRFRRAQGGGGFASHHPVVPLVDSFFPSSHRLSYGPQSLATRHSSSSWSNQFSDMWK